MIRNVLEMKIKEILLGAHQRKELKLVLQAKKVLRHLRVKTDDSECARNEAKGNSVGSSAKEKKLKLVLQAKKAQASAGQDNDDPSDFMSF